MVAATKDGPDPDAITMTVSSKGQVVIPKAVRERLNLRTGDVLEVEEDGDTIVLKVRRESLADQKLRLFGPPVSFDAVAGSLRHLVQADTEPGPRPASNREMRTLAHSDFARRWREKEARVAAQARNNRDSKKKGEP